ncbi:DnaJ subfamily C member 17-like [Homarus americanus]|uniref:DnaJ subfamily C member 17-like n=1 Tax=Homarus americanus TaxID=6706 RepID=A0A8J5NFS9_HOMAM|nr:DnaJ subfamily C member 17-like [Homarus americanus]
MPKHRGSGQIWRRENDVPSGPGTHNCQRRKTWKEVTVRCLCAAWRPLWPECVLQRDFEGFEELEEEAVVHEIVSLGNSMGLEVDDDDVEELVEEHSKELSTEELLELHKEQNETLKRSLTSEESGEEEDKEESRIIPAKDLKDAFFCWSKLSKLAEDYHLDVGSVQKAISVFRRELKRLEEEGERLIEEELTRVNKQVEEELSRGTAKVSKSKETPSTDSNAHRVKVKWAATEDWPGYTEQDIHQLFFKWGDINALVMQQKTKKGTALIDFKTKQGAPDSNRNDPGLSVNKSPGTPSLVITLELSVPSSGQHSRQHEGRPSWQTAVKRETLPGVFEPDSYDKYLVLSSSEINLKDQNIFETY